MATKPNYSESKEYAAKKKLELAQYDAKRGAFQNVGTSEQSQTNAPGETGHYSRFNPQPIDIIAAWNLDHWQAEAITYIVRHDMKGGREDLEKAIWYLRDLIERRYGD